MTRISQALPLLVLFLSLANSALAGETLVAFINVNVVPMDSERVLPGQTVITRGDRIIALGPLDAVPVPRHGVHLDGRGKYLLPGITEMHGHLPGPRDSRTLTGNTLFLYVANGVTLLRGMQGHPQQLAIRDEIAAGALLGPRLLVSSPPFSGRSVLSARQASALVAEAAKLGFDHLKIHEGLTPDVYEAIVEAAGEHDLAFAGHVPNEVGLLNALQAGQHSIDHMDNYVEALIEDDELRTNPETLTPPELVNAVNEARLPLLIEATRKAGAAVVPTMALWENFFGAVDPAVLRKTTLGLRYVPPRQVDLWSMRLSKAREGADGGKIISLRRKILGALAAGDATVLFGTDSPQLFSVPGFSIHREMQIMVEAGMTPYQVLASASSEVARFYDAAGDFGQVAVGQRADLILLNANPLDDIARLQDRAGVMVAGRWLAETEIQQRLDAIAAAYR